MYFSIFKVIKKETPCDDDDDDDDDHDDDHNTFPFQFVLPCIILLMAHASIIISKLFNQLIDLVLLILLPVCAPLHHPSNGPRINLP